MPVVPLGTPLLSVWEDPIVVSFILSTVVYAFDKINQKVKINGRSRVR